MSKLTNVRDKVVSVLTSVVLVAPAVSQITAEIAEVLIGWDGQLANLVALFPAIVFAIRRVTPVAKEERGLT